MKKFFSKTVFAVAAIAAGLSSCSHDSNVYSPEDPFQKQEALYNKAFAEQFGTPAEGHDWGFGEGGSRAAVSRGAFTNANEWWQYINVPAKLTEDQVKVVTDWFTTHQNPTGVSVNWTDYFVQNVSCTAWGENMNQLFDAKNHLNNFNAGHGNKQQVYVSANDPNNPTQEKWDHEDEIQLITNSSTAEFSYHNSFESATYKDYVIIPGDIIDPIVAGMYFVGFDFQANGQSDKQKVALDGYFNDWIVRICPGEYLPTQISDPHTTVERVIAEDLGAVGDFDFNDVVFDVRQCTNDWPNYTLITVRAAGGTMPLYIEGKEVHELFGVETKTMVNTGAKACPIAQFTIEGLKDAKDIKITVDNGEITFNLENADAPKKICVGADYEWCAEKQNIKAKYPNYVKYVADPTYKDWYK